MRSAELSFASSTVTALTSLVCLQSFKRTQAAKLAVEISIADESPESVSAPCTPSHQSSTAATMQS